MLRELMPFLTRWGAPSRDVTMQVLYDSPLLFELTGRALPTLPSGKASISFEVTEEVHDYDLPEDSPGLVLHVDGKGPFAPVVVERLLNDPHHRTTLYLFPSEDDDGAPLIKGGHQVLALSLSEPLGDCDPGGPSDDSELVWHLPISPSTPSGTLTPLSLDDAAVIQVHGADAGFHPDQLSLVKGQRVVLVFQNTGAAEHHLHAREMPSEDILWLSSQEAGPMPSDINSLRTALFLPYHACDSESGICPTGIDVHLHARAGEWLAISFVPSMAGTYTMSCPLHPEMTGTIVVREK